MLIDCSRPTSIITNGWDSGVDLSGGQTYTTQPGSRLLFPMLCRPTAPVTVTRTDVPDADLARTLKMPRRNRTRVQARTQRRSPAPPQRRLRHRTRQTPTLLGIDGKRCQSPGTPFELVSAAVLELQP